MQPEQTMPGGKMEIDERTSIIKEFEWAITDLQKVTEELHSRLAPVTRSEPAEMPDDHVLGTSEARTRLHDLQLTTASLRSLISRLEV